MKIRHILDTAILSACGFFVVAPAMAIGGGYVMKVPEPGTLSVLGLGIGALYLISRHKRRK